MCFPQQALNHLSHGRLSTDYEIITDNTVELRVVFVDSVKKSSLPCNLNILNVHLINKKANSSNHS